MKEEVKKQWIAALCSGEYEQGYEYLHRDGKFCCLGVLCELAIKAGVPVSRAEHSDKSGYPITEYDKMSSFLPKSVKEWSGLEVTDPMYDSTHLAGLNDDGNPFPVIAKVIEEHY